MAQGTETKTRASGHRTHGTERGPTTNHGDSQCACPEELVSPGSEEKRSSSSKSWHPFSQVTFPFPAVSAPALGPLSPALRGPPGKPPWFPTQHPSKAVGQKWPHRWLGPGYRQLGKNHIYLRTKKSCTCHKIVSFLEPTGS